jgi:guanylate kinase
MDPPSELPKLRQRLAEFRNLWATWINDHPTRYGTLKASVIEPLARGQNLVMSIDVQGVESLRRVAARDAWLRRANEEVG